MTIAIGNDRCSRLKPGLCTWWIPLALAMANTSIETGRKWVVKLLLVWVCPILGLWIWIVRCYNMLWLTTSKLSLEWTAMMMMVMMMMMMLLLLFPCSRGVSSGKSMSKVCCFRLSQACNVQPRLQIPHRTPLPARHALKCPALYPMHLEKTWEKDYILYTVGPYHPRVPKWPKDCGSLPVLPLILSASLQNRLRASQSQQCRRRFSVPDQRQGRDDDPWQQPLTMAAGSNGVKWPPKCDITRGYVNYKDEVPTKINFWRKIW